MKRLLAVSVAIVLLLSGCTTVTGFVTFTEPVDFFGNEVPIADSAELVGVWAVTETPDAEPSSWVRFDKHVRVWDGCNAGRGTWRASGNALLVEIALGAGHTCGEATIPNPDWINESVQFDVVDGSPTFYDADSRVVATLTRGLPEAGPDLPDGFSHQPDESVEPPYEKHLNSLPEGAVPATDLDGVWVDREHGSHDVPSLKLSGSHWTSTGCNGDWGRWLVSFDGRLMRLNQSGVHTLMGCPLPASAATYFADAASIAMVGDELTMYDSHHNKLGALVRQ